jgi:TonB family protein
MRYFRVLTLSLALHLLLALAISLLPNRDHDRLNSKQMSYVDLLETPDLPQRPKQLPRDEKPIVRSAPAPEELKTDEKKETRFSSEEEQYVLEEQKARNNGMTANRSQTAPPKNPAQKELNFAPDSALDRAREDLLEGTSDNDIRVGRNDDSENPERRDQESSDGKNKAADGSKALILPGFVAAERGLSTLGNELPDDIKFGNFTALNTDRNLYYSFYARMEELIRFRWETYVKAAIFELAHNQQRVTARDKWTTKLEIVLDPSGNFERAILMESSGVRSFDNAPVQAFRDAGLFPNPPQEMVRDDGKIHVYYTFTIDVLPKYAIQK